MKPNDEVFEQSVPHEAGHVLLAYCFRIPVKHIAYRIRSEFDGRIISAIANPSAMPSDEEKRAHCLVASAGMAGEVVATGVYDRANLDPRNPDKRVVHVLASAGLTDFLQPAQEIIVKNKEAFDALCSAIRERYPEIKARIISSAQPGIYPLLVTEDLDKILAGVTPSGKAKAARKQSKVKRARKAKSPRKRS